MSGPIKLEDYYCKPAAKALRKMGKKDPERFQIVKATVGNVIEFGWDHSCAAGLIKPIRNTRRLIYEIKDTGKGGHRLFFFCDDREAGTRRLYITSVVPKASLTNVFYRIESRKALQLRERHINGEEV